MPKIELTASGRSGRRGRVARTSSSLAEINVVPLVDVMLVLLIIFMVAAPMMKQGFAVKLPQSRQARAVDAPVTVTLPAQFRRDRRILIDDEPVPFTQIPERIKYALNAKVQKSVVLAGDGVLSFADVMAVWDQLSAGGVENINVQTQPFAGDRR